MYCKNCGAPYNEFALACPSCGWVRGQTIPSLKNREIRISLTPLVLLAVLLTVLFLEILLHFFKFIGSKQQADYYNNLFSSSASFSMDYFSFFFPLLIWLVYGLFLLSFGFVSRKRRTILSVMLCLYFGFSLFSPIYYSLIRSYDSLTSLTVNILITIIIGLFSLSPIIILLIGLLLKKSTEIPAAIMGVVVLLLDRFLVTLLMLISEKRFSPSAFSPSDSLFRFIIPLTLSVISALVFSLILFKYKALKFSLLEISKGHHLHR